jgi:hypothetical protein
MMGSNQTMVNQHTRAMIERWRLPYHFDTAVNFAYTVQQISSNFDFGLHSEFEAISVRVSAPNHARNQKAAVLMEKFC